MQIVRDRLQLPSQDPAPAGRGVRVAVFDTGIDTAHPDLLGRVDRSTSKVYTGLDASPEDRTGHGTHIAGIIGGTGEASRGVYAGVAPGCTLVSYKISSKGSSLEIDAAKAIEDALADGIDIINFSNGRKNVFDLAGHAPWLWPARLSALEEAFQIATSRGVLCVVAAGNEGPAEGSVVTPAGLEAVLTVGAVDRSGAIWRNSSRGPFRRGAVGASTRVCRFDRYTSTVSEEIQKPDVVAPGQDVTAPRSGLLPPVDDISDPDYLSMSGTSQATAVVTGVAARLLGLAREHQIHLGPNQAVTLKKLIRHAARTLEDAAPNEAGAGIVLWPVLQATLRDFGSDPGVRAAVLAGASLRLL